MSEPVVIRGVTSFQYRAYRAEHVAIAQLAREGALLGWETFDDLTEFHREMADRFRKLSGRRLPVLSKGTGSTSSRYYPSEHRMKILKRDLNVVVYSHELAHAGDDRAWGKGHHKAWASMFLKILEEIDFHSAVVLYREFKQERLTVRPSYRVSHGK